MEVILVQNYYITFERVVYSLRLTCAYYFARIIREDKRMTILGEKTTLSRYILSAIGIKRNIS